MILTKLFNDSVTSAEEGNSGAIGRVRSVMSAPT